MREDYGFEDGLFTGYDADKRKYDKTSWNYELDEKASPNAMSPCNTRAACGTC